MICKERVKYNNWVTNVMYTMPYIHHRRTSNREKVFLILCLVHFVVLIKLSNKVLKSPRSVDIVLKLLELSKVYSKQIKTENV